MHGRDKSIGSHGDLNVGWRDDGDDKIAANRLENPIA
tara:strand:+ start:162126 stop:162236 length:111 start_codon:yes stop_codon:yes gene_type:complete